MSNGEMVVRGEDVPAIADDFLIQVADQAEKRIDAVIKIKRVALKVTNARDWTDQNGNPYLQVSGSEKIANLFNISWRIEEPRYEEEPDGHFTYSFKGEFSLGGRRIECEGTRSSKDTFFNKYEWKGDEGKKVKVTLPPSAIDKGDVKKAALTNLFGNGITRILGIRNLTWEDIKEFAGITKDQVVSVKYKKDGEKPPITTPQAKSAPAINDLGDPAPDADGNFSVDSVVHSVEQKKGEKDNKPWTKYFVSAGGEKFSTFDKKIAEVAKASSDMSIVATIIYKKTQYGNEIVSLTVPEERLPGVDG